MKEKICVWIVENAHWIKELRDEDGFNNYMNVIFEQKEFDQLCESINTHTPEEEYYVNGLTDEKGSLICELIRKVFG